MSKSIYDLFAIASSNSGTMWSHFQKCDKYISSNYNICS